MRDPNSENAKAALALRDRDRARRAELRETLDEMDQTNQTLAKVKGLIADAEARAIWLCPAVPVADPAFLTRCKTVASEMELAFQSPSPAYAIVLAQGVTAILYPDRLVIDGTPSDDAAHIIAEFASFVFGKCKVVGPAGVAGEKMQFAVARVAERSSAPRIFEADDDAFPMPPRRRAPGRIAEASPFLRQYRDEMRRLFDDIEESTRSIRAQGGLDATLAARNQGQASVPGVRGAGVRRDGF